MSRNAATLLVPAALAAAALVGHPAAAPAQWQPERPINIIVPWGAGGSTDQVTRVVAPLIEEALGQSVVIVIQPGASGAIGTQAALDAPRDGYTWTANAIANNATYTVTGLIEDTSIDDYHLYLHIANVPVVGVPADSPFQDFGDLLEAFRERGDEITVATAGVTSSGGTAIATLAQHGDFQYRMVTYDGGNPAVIAAAAGEAMVTTQLASEQSEMIRGGRIRPLAALSAGPLEIEGIDPIPSITEWMTDMPVAPDYFGVFIPRGVPGEVVETMNQVWTEVVSDSDALRQYARERGAIFSPSFGDEARSRAMPIVIEEACGRVARGEAVNDPSVIGIDCETMSEM